jgi:hypothetical protein
MSALPGRSRSTGLGGTGDFVRPQLAERPTLVIDSDPREVDLRCISVRNLPPDLVAPLGRCSQAVLRAMLRVRVVGTGADAGEDLPNVFGHHQVLEDGVRFIPHFPFEPGIRLRATFDPGPLGRAELSDVLTLEFSLPEETKAERTHVEHVFPSSDSLPENLLRFYACFSAPMQRGWAEENIRVLGPDGRPASDVLYRPPLELWDGSMMCLTILLDPGRLKRGVGPNRALGQPLKAGEEYALVIGSGMIDLSGRPLSEGFGKPFQVTKAVREPIALAQWEILRPRAMSRQPLELTFPVPLDWAQLWHAITVVSEGGRLMEGRIAIEHGERRWSLTPKSPWKSGSYDVRIASDLEDVCGNTPLEAFDRPLRSASDLRSQVGSRSIPFDVKRRALYAPAPGFENSPLF